MHLRSARWFLLIATAFPFLHFSAMAGDASVPPVSFTRAPSWEALFRRDSGWIGGDVADSVDLGNGRILWLFGDSLIGKVREGRREIHGMTRNAVAIQEGSDPSTARIRFYTGPSSLRGFFAPSRKGGWIWPCQGGILTSAGLYLFLPEMTSASGKDDWGFRVRRMTLAKILNPRDDPNHWVIRRYRMPFFLGGPGREVVFGIPAGRSGPWIVVTGHEGDSRTGSRRMLAARIMGDRLEDFSRWEFRTSTGWSHDMGKAAPLCDDIGFERSVSFHTALGRWILVTSERGLSDRILCRTAPKPWGPWSRSRLLYRVGNAGKGRFSYAAKLHQEGIDSGCELLLSYVRNTSDARRLSDPDLYRPEFVSARLSDPSGSGLP